MKEMLKKKIKFILKCWSYKCFYRKYNESFNFINLYFYRKKIYIKWVIVLYVKYFIVNLYVVWLEVLKFDVICFKCLLIKI